MGARSAYGALKESDGPSGVHNVMVDRRALITSFVFLGLPFLVVTLYLSALPQVCNHKCFCDFILTLCFQAARRNFDDICTTKI